MNANQISCLLKANVGDFATVAFKYHSIYRERLIRYSDHYFSPDIPNLYYYKFPIIGKVYISRTNKYSDGEYPCIGSYDKRFYYLGPYDFSQFKFKTDYPYVSSLHPIDIQAIKIHKL